MRGVIHCVWLLVLIWEPFSNRFLLIFLEFAFPPILTLYQLIVSSILAHYLYSDFLTFCLLYLFDLLVTVVLTLVHTHTHTQLTDHGNNKFTLTVSAQLCMLLTTLHLCSLLNMQWCTLTSSVTHTHTHTCSGTHIHRLIKLLLVTTESLILLNGACNTAWFHLQDLHM